LTEEFLNGTQFLNYRIEDGCSCLFLTENLTFVSELLTDFMNLILLNHLSIWLKFNKPSPQDLLDSKKKRSAQGLANPSPALLD